MATINEDVAAVQKLILNGNGNAPGGGISEEQMADVEAKRRRFGRFVGLRGCDTPATGGLEEEKMGRDMETWLAGEIRKREERDAERGMWKQKGLW